MNANPNQAAVNRQNALASTGPQTPEGKERSARNALKHGLRSSAFVIPGLEREEDWKRHLSAILESVKAETYLEAVLAQDVALLTWRLGRVARAEREAVALLQETAEEDWNEAHQRPAFSPGRSSQADLDELRHNVTEAAELVGDLTAFPNLPPEAWRDGRAELLLLAVAQEAYDLDLADPAEFRPPEPVPNETFTDFDFRGWSPELLEAAAAEVALTADLPLADLLRDAVTAAERAQEAAVLQLQQAEEEVKRLQRSRILPTEADLEKVSRYEAHLRRSLSKTLQELRLLQAGRGSLTEVTAG